jgi:hypothetical protein
MVFSSVQGGRPALCPSGRLRPNQDCPQAETAKSGPDWRVRITDHCFRSRSGQRGSILLPLAAVNGSLTIFAHGTEPWVVIEQGRPVHGKTQRGFSQSPRPFFLTHILFALGLCHLWATLPCCAHRLRRMIGSDLSDRAMYRSDTRVWPPETKILAA